MYPPPPPFTPVRTTSFIFMLRQWRIRALPSTTFMVVNHSHSCFSLCISIQIYWLFMYLQCFGGCGRPAQLVNINALDRRHSGFGGIVVSMLSSGTQVRGFKPGQSRRFFGRKNPQHAFLRSFAAC
jgi:hypothetical protein